MNSRKPYQLDKIKQKIYHFCAYRERCHQEVKEKLYGMGVYAQDVNELMAGLIEDDFLNEERFAKAYCRGKFYHNDWGRVKIMQGLKQRKISDYCIRSGMKEVQEQAYRETLERLTEQYQKKWHHLKPYALRQRTIRYLMQKGYEYPVIEQQLMGDE